MPDRMPDIIDSNGMLTVTGETLISLRSLNHCLRFDGARWVVAVAPVIQRQHYAPGAGGSMRPTDVEHV